jgi:hypothetical protein
MHFASCHVLWELLQIRFLVVVLLIRLLIVLNKGRSSCLRKNHNQYRNFEKATLNWLEYTRETPEMTKERRVATAQTAVTPINASLAGLCTREWRGTEVLLSISNRRLRRLKSQKV